VSGPWLQLHEVTLRFGERSVLDAVTLGFAAGTVTALVGPNGAGKSTLLAVAAGDLVPTSGRATLHGRPINDWRSRELARERSVMPQDHSVRFAFTVDDVVAMGRLPHPADAERDHHVIEHSLQQAEMVPLRHRQVQSLSGGEAARATFARVLAQQTRMVMLDEPTAALDLRHQERTLRAVRALADAGACVIVVVHDLNLAAGHADRIVMLQQGRVAADGCPREVLTREHIERVYQQPVLVLEHPQRGVPLVVVADP